MVDPLVMVKFRGLVSTFHAANGALADAERRRNSAIQARSALQAERTRLGLIRYATPVAEADHQSALARLDAEIAKAEAEVAALTAEHERLEGRRDDANANASRARDFLMERFGLARSALEY